MDHLSCVAGTRPRGTDFFSPDKQIECLNTKVNWCEQIQAMSLFRIA
jgi:hypothetical protein